MENFINSLPKPLLALLVLGGAIIFFVLANPMHTICDTQIETLRVSQTGPIFPQAVTVKGLKQKQTLPPKILQAKEACQIGNSSGSCFEYFSILKSLATDVGKGATECTTQLYDIAEVKKALNDGIEVMARIAWGGEIPELWWNRSGWMQESELAVFCRLKNVYIRAQGQEAWTALQKSVFTKFPGESLPPETDPTKAVAEPKKANQMLKEEDIHARSIFAMRCESFR